MTMGYTGFSVLMKAKCTDKREEKGPSIIYVFVGFKCFISKLKAPIGTPKTNFTVGP